MFCRTLAGNSVSFVVSFGDHLFTQSLVIGLVAIGAFHIFAQLFAQLHLSQAVFLDLGVSEFDSFEHVCLRNLFHLTLDHQNVVVCSAHHDIQIGIFVLGVGRVDNKFTIDARHTHL